MAKIRYKADHLSVVGSRANSSRKMHETSRSISDDEVEPIAHDTRFVRASDEVLWRPQTLGEWCQEVDAEPDPEWLLDSLVPADCLIKVTGTAKIARKTFFVMHMAGAIARGQPTSLLDPVDPDGLPILFIEQEGSRKGTRGRWRKIQYSMGMDLEALDNFYWVHREPELLIDNNLWIDRLCDFVVAEDVKFVVLDTLAMVATHNENSVQETMATIRFMKRLQAANRCTVLFIHHLSKPPKQHQGGLDIDEESRGSSALSGAYDVHFALRQRQPNQQHLNLTVRAKEFEERYFNVEWHMNSERADLHMTEVSREDQFNNYCRDVRNSVSEGQLYTSGSIIHLTGDSKAMASRVLMTLADEGVFEKSGQKYRCLVDGRFSKQ